MARNMDYREQNRKLQNEINYRIIQYHKPSNRLDYQMEL